MKIVRYINGKRAEANTVKNCVFRSSVIAIVKTGNKK